MKQKRQEQCDFVCVYMGVHMSGIVCIEIYLNIMEDFVVCLCLEYLYMCECMFGSMCLRARVYRTSVGRAAHPKNSKRCITC